MAPTKNVVIIGSHGGAHAIRAIEKSLPANVRLILIEKNDYAFYPPAALRASVAPGQEDLVFADLKGTFAKDSKHVVLSSTEVTALHEKSVTINKDFEGSNEIPFEYAILATGATYAKPSRPAGSSKDEVRAGFKKQQEEVKKAQSILVVGGGPVGVEFVGEVMALYPEKKVTLVSRSSSLIDGIKPAVGQKLVGILEQSKSVDLKLGTSIELPSDIPSASLLPQARQVRLSDGTQVETDFVLVATGGKPNTTLVAQSGYESAINDKGAIKVDPKTLRVLDPKLGFYFGLGDCTDAPGTKTTVSIQSQAPVVASQINSLLQGKGKAGKLYKEGPEIMIVSYGPNNGAGVLMGWSLPSFAATAMKSKGLFVSGFRALYNKA